MCACAAFRRIVSKSCAELRMLNCLSFFIFPPFPLKWVRASARFEAFGREPGHRRLAKCDAGSSQTGGFFPAAAGILCAAPGLARTLAQHGFFRLCRAHPAAGAQSRTQRRHAPHGAHRALGTPTGSIVPIVFTGRKSALSARLREIHRLPLLR